MAQYWLSYIDALIKLDKITDAKTVFEQAKSKGAKGNIFDQLEAKLGTLSSKNGNTQDPPQNQIKTLLDFYNKGLLQQTLEKATELAQQYPGSAILFNIQGVALQGLGNLKTAIQAYENALKLNPDYAEAYCNMGNALQKQGETLEAIKACKKAITINPKSAEAFNNLGLALQNHGKMKEALVSYNKAIEICPNIPEPYNNIGNILKDEGKLEEAITAYKKAISMQPSFTEAHRNLSDVKRYNINDNHFKQVKRLLRFSGLSNDAKCNLNFTLAKIYGDLNLLKKAFEHLHAGNSLGKAC